MSTLELNSLEVLYRHERPDSNVNAWLFSNGIDRYCVLGGHTLTVLGGGTLLVYNGLSGSTAVFVR